MNMIVKMWQNRRRREERRESSSRLPSLVQGISLVASNRVMREVISSSYDRRQWALLAAGWMGLSEREFMRRVAEKLGVELQERVAAVDLSVCGAAAEEHLQALRSVGAIPVMEEQRAVGFIAIDPAELRNVSLYDGTQSVSLAAWSDISRALDASEQLLGEAASAQRCEEAQARESLCLRVCELLCNEAHSHGSSSLDILISRERAEYRFTASNGQEATGAIHAGAVTELMNFLCSRPGNLVHSTRVGPVVIRMLGGPSHLRLAWGKATSPSVVVENLPAPLSVGERAHSTVADPGHISTGIAGVDDRSILVVDDNLMFGRVLEKLLKREGFEPSFAGNGAEAYERLTQLVNFVPRVIVCDLHMPVMNGKEFLTRLRADERFKSVPVIMLTSDEDIEAEVGLLESGADAFVSKSKDPRVLCAQIRKLARRADLREAA
jgi:CheY-like chemotaxis protein